MKFIRMNQKRFLKNFFRRRRKICFATANLLCCETCGCRCCSGLDMAANVCVCETDEGLKEKLKHFRKSKRSLNAAMILKIDRNSRLIQLEDELDNCSVGDIRSALPERTPRFVLYSFRLEHQDGRISYPLCLIFSSPLDCKPELSIMYAGSMLSLQRDAQLNKAFEVRDVEELTDDWLRDHVLRCKQQ